MGQASTKCMTSDFYKDPKKHLELSSSGMPKIAGAPCTHWVG